VILTGNEIKKQVESGRIHLRPFEEGLVNPNSYNYRLGDTLLELEDVVIDPAKEPSYKEHIIGSEGFVLKPGRLYLASTLEEIGSDHYVTTLIGRSSVGRLGLFLQITADLGHVGAKHAWTLELKVVQPLRVYRGMRIGQVSFWRVSGRQEHKYSDGYSSFSKPKGSKIYKELGK
jgi:dCTP deaminase